jgi:predicted HD phosphohydrolase
MIACLAHDIGYVRGLLKEDTAGEYVADMAGNKVTLPRGASDAALTPYHVDRSKIFVLERLSENKSIDAARVAAAIEFTRFPVESAVAPNDNATEASLVRAADLIGQLGDPCYLNKTNALFCEFREIGIAKKFNYESPADLVDSYPDFFWRSVSPHIGAAVRYLKMTIDGRTWLAHLNSNVLSAAGVTISERTEQ